MPLLGALGAATGAIAIGAVAMSTSTTIIISTGTPIGTSIVVKLARVVSGSTIRSTVEMLPMEIEGRPTNLADVAPVVRVALVVPEDPVELAVQGALVVPEDPAVPVALERDLVQVEAELVRDRPRVQRAVPLKTKSAIALHPRGLHPLLAAAEDLAAAVAEITLAPAAAEAVIAWEVADIVAAEVAVVVAEAAVAVAVEDAGDKETNCE